MATKSKGKQDQGQQDAGTNGKGTKCPITREEFKKNARPVTVVINGVPFAAAPKKNLDEGSLGLFLNDKVTIEIGGVPVKFQIGLNLTAIGSKDLP
jgi:hypothetical protein